MPRVPLSILILSALALAGGCTGNGTTTTASSSLACTATATLVSTSATGYQVSGLSVAISSGTAPYEVTVPTLGTTSSSAATFSYTGSISLATSDTVVSIVDAEGSATSCAIDTGSTTTTSTGAIALTVSPSTSVAVGTTVTLTASALDGSAGSTFTFALTSGSSGVTLQTSSSTVAYVTSTVATSAVVTVSEFRDGALRNTDSRTITYGSSTSTTSLTCTLQFNVPTVYTGQRMYLRFLTSTGEPITLHSWDPGESWGSTPSFPVTLASGRWIWLTYDTAGTKSHVIYATGATSGIACNGGAALTGTVSVY